MSLLFLKPIFKERLWGNDYFKNKLNYKLSNEPFGELWSISAHQEGETTIINGKYNGLSLKELYYKEPKIFNSCEREYPLMVKLISTSKPLSVQVHPDNEYAQIHNGGFGKSECWYFIQTNNKSSIVLGHYAKTKNELIQAINEGLCENLLINKYVKPHDFVFIPAKTIHALGSDLLLLEIQQSSDLTYRLYDYNRVDKYGQKRALHIEDALNVIEVPQHELPNITNYDNHKQGLICLSKNDFFEAWLWDTKIQNNVIIEKEIFHQFSVVLGSINIIYENISYTLHQGESFIASADTKSLRVTGNALVIISFPNN